PTPRSSTKAWPAGPTRGAPAPASASTSTSWTPTPNRSSRSTERLEHQVVGAEVVLIELAPAGRPPPERVAVTVFESERRSPVEVAQCFVNGVHRATYQRFAPVQQREA